VPFNVLLLDVTEPLAPQLLPGGLLSLTTSPRNRRSRWPLDVRLQPGREYRLVARVTSSRLSPPPAPLPLDQGVLTVRGALDLTAAMPCDGQAVGAAPVLTDGVALALCLGVRTDSPWLDLGFGKAGSGGSVPQLVGTGPLTPGSTNALLLTGGPPSATALVVLGLSNLGAMFKGAVLVPSLDLVVTGTLPPDGNATIPFQWPLVAPPDTPSWYQVWLVDPGASGGLSASNGVKGISAE
jgi:hypothetical protein